MEPVVVVARLVRFGRILRILIRRELTFHVPQQGARSPAFLECGSIGERLQRGARLAQRQSHVDLPIDRLVVEVRRADHDQDLAGAGPQRDQGPVPDLVLLGQTCDLLVDNVFCGGLQFWVQGGVDRETGPVDRLGIEAGLQLGPHVVHPVREADRDVRRVELVLDQLCRSRARQLRGDAQPLDRVAHIDAPLLVAGLHHEYQNLSLAIQRSFPVDKDIIDRGGLNQPG